MEMKLRITFQRNVRIENKYIPPPSITMGFFNFM
jgi:hypothetical protein